MSDYRKHEFLSGLFIMAALVVFTLFAFKVGNYDVFAALRPDSLQCQAYFPNVGSLSSGSKVMVGGQRVGQVTGISLVPAADLAKHAVNGRIQSMIEVTFDIEDSTLVFNPETAAVVLTRDGLLGGHFVDLNPGYWTTKQPPQNADHSKLKEPVVFKSGSEAGFEDVIAEARPAIENANLLLQDLRLMMATINQDVISPDKSVGVLKVLVDLDDAVLEGKVVLDRLNELTEFEHKEGLHQRLILPLQKLIEDADKNVNNLSDVLRNETLASVNEILDDGKVVMKDAKETLALTKDLFDKGNPKVHAILDDLKQTTEDLDGYLASISENSNKLLTSLQGTVSENRADIRETVRRLRQAMWQAEMALRKIRSNPAVLLVGDSEKDLEARPTDQTKSRIQGKARPYGQRDEGDTK